MKINYHTHTKRCQHAFGEEEEYIKQAISLGFTTLGFSDHVPLPFNNSYISSIRMRMDEIDNYFDTLLRLKEKYKNQIYIPIGFEAEYYPDMFDKLMEVLSSYPTDYLILGQHGIPCEPGGFYCGAPFADEKILQMYVDRIIDALQTGIFSYVAHPDLINYQGEDIIYYRHMSRLCSVANDTSTPLEVNLLGLYDGRNYPCGRFFQLASSMDCKFIVGCDAHRPEQIIDPDNEPKFEKFINENGIIYNQDITLRKVL